MSQYADPRCAICGGSGFLYRRRLLDGGESCECTKRNHAMVAMKKTWPALARVEGLPREGKYLQDRIEENLRITAPSRVFMGALKEAWVSVGALWSIKVVQDAQIVESWFTTAKAEGVQIFDLEVEDAVVSAIDVRSLVEPCGLCVVVLGVKALPNKECPNALLEALHYREQAGKPTWVWDQPTAPLAPGHKFYSENLWGHLAEWEHISFPLPTVREAPRVVTRPKIEIEDVLEVPDPPPPSLSPPPAPSGGEGETKNLLGSGSAPSFETGRRGRGKGKKWDK